jgi:CDGSH-type Zn-finger protein
MPGVRYRAALCRCGRSSNKPFCDNSHLEAGFQDYGSVGEGGPGLAAIGGPLTVKPLTDGPLLVNGNLTIHAGSGRVAWQGAQVALCRCGASKNKPFCDGSHKAAGFRSG